MIMRRLRQLSLLLFSFLICGVAFFQLFARTGSTIPTNFAVLLGLVVALSLVFWGLVLHFLPYASQVIQPCVLLLTGLGTVMIARIDHEHDTEVATRQLMFVCLAIVLSSILIVAMRDYRYSAQVLLCQHGGRPGVAAFPHASRARPEYQRRAHLDPHPRSRLPAAG